MRGFSLLELSIVLVIIGLIAGGVVAGSSMIKAAETRSLISDIEKYRTSINVFRDKYLGLPGDLKNATQFWGKDNALCATHTGTVATDGTCNGDGDRKIPDFSEPWYFWNHLSHAELVAGYFEIYDTAGGADMELGKNTPDSALSGGSFRISYYAVRDTDNWFYDGVYKHYLRFGRPNNSGGCPTCFNRHAEMTAERVMAMDNKLDDGKPGTGVVRAVKPSTGGGVHPTSCTDDADPAATYTAAYRANINTDAGAECIPVFLLGF